jgi:hypothetical protein
MTIASTRKMLCEKLTDQFNSLIAPAQEQAAIVKRQIAEIKTQLANLTFSPEIDIDDAINDIEQDVNDAIPGTAEEDVQEILDFIEGCEFLQNDDTLSNPISLTKSAIASSFNTVENIIDTYTTFPEFGVGDIIGKVLDKFGPSSLELPDNFSLTDIMKQADRLINCLADRCGSDYSTIVSDYINILNDLYEDLGMDPNPLSNTWGELDLTSIYSDAGLNPSQILQIDKVKDSVQSAKSTSVNAINGSVNSIKNVGRSVGALF